MARCTRCGRDNAPNAAACAACGSALVAAPAVRRPGAPAIVPAPPAPVATPTRPAVPATPQMPAAVRPPPIAPQAGPGAGLRCGACGATIPPGFKFCGACGAPVVVRPAPVPPPPAAVRRPGGAARARIVLLAQDGSAVSSFALANDETTVGTNGEVRLTDPFCAPLQGRFVFRGPSLAFRPEKTQNGAFLLLRRDVELPLGAELRVGRQLLRLDAFPIQAPAPEPRWGSPNPGYRFRIQQLLLGGVDGDAFPLRDGDSLVGRTAGDISFPGDGYVSSRHAALTVRSDRVVLRDLGSSNGTFVRIDQESALEPGDLILVGEQLLRIDPA